jgi:quercetin dioxygenase-like cupin family protein
MVTRSLNDLADELAAGAVAPIMVDGQPILCVSVYETPRSQAEMYLLKAGQRIPAHKHSAIDDVFLCVRGRGQIRTWDVSCKPTEGIVEAGSVVVIEPGTPHEVSCAGDEFCYVLTQSPKEQYDSVSYSAPEPVVS